MMEAGAAKTLNDHFMEEFAANVPAVPTDPVLVEMQLLKLKIAPLYFQCHIIVKTVFEVLLCRYKLP